MYKLSRHVKKHFPSPLKQTRFSDTILCYGQTDNRQAAQCDDLFHTRQTSYLFVWRRRGRQTRLFHAAMFCLFLPRAMHFSAKRGLAIACRPSVRP